jgi:hypothetical protein
MKQILRFSIILIVFFACHRKEVDFLGPAFISAPEGFAVTSFTATPASIDFTSGSVAFNAAFTNTVTWTLTITGQKSGAVHVIRGVSNGLTNIVWTGKMDGVAFFKIGETATATLTFFGTSLTSSVNINIIAVPDYRTCGGFAPGGDFEALAVSPLWHPFNVPPIPNVVQGISATEMDYKGNKVVAIQGNRYYFIRGLGNQANFVSGIQYDPGAPKFTTIFTPALPANADIVWVNMYIYGTGDPNAQVQLEYQEADASDTKSPGVYKGTDDDAYVTYITLDHIGWKLFSFQYSKLTPSLNALFGGSGNKIHEPNTLRSFDLVLVKQSNPNSPVEVYFDYPIITVGGPFKPCK